MLGITCIHSTAYHPSSTGMVERFYCQLKSSIKAYHDPAKWTEISPLVLLGTRSIIKTDLHCTPAQLVYDTILRLPCQFMTSTSSTALDPTVYIDRLQHSVHDLTPVQPRSHAVKSHLLKDLSTCTHFFVHTNSVRTLLQPPYRSPSHNCASRQACHFGHSWSQRTHQHRSFKSCLS